MLTRQVGEFRKIMGKDVDAVANHFDGSGLKKLFSHGIRRFNANAKNSATWLKRSVNHVHVFFCVWLLVTIERNPTPQQSFNKPYFHNCHRDLRILLFPAIVII